MIPAIVMERVLVVAVLAMLAGSVTDGLTGQVLSLAGVLALVFALVAYLGLDGIVKARE